ncbi:ricin-type beta-trefoil lectin domain protein [Streptomyces sp. NPDC004284]|uniref:ricin-type beta-trefoil lectin domain protein n=1 Tax=Streptomyces sp. NPDC004284 TaxID=3364695 RepID=UPI0036B0879E
MTSHQNAVSRVTPNHRKGVMTTSPSNDSPDEPAAVASEPAGAEGIAETEGIAEAEAQPESAASMAERILTPARPQGRSAVPAAMAEPEAEEPEQQEGEQETEEAEADPPALDVLALASASGPSTSTSEPAARTSADPSATPSPDGETSNADTANAETSAEASAETSAETAAESATESDDATGGSDTTAAKADPGRPHKSLLAGAAIVGALLISVPFLISGGDGDDSRSSAKPGATPGTVLEGMASAVPGVVGSESPSPSVSPAKGGAGPKGVTITGPNGKPIAVTGPKAGAGDGKKPTGGGGPVRVNEEPGKPPSGSGGASGGTTSGSGGTSSHTSSSSGSTSGGTSSGSGSTSTSTSSGSGSTSGGTSSGSGSTSGGTSSGSGTKSDSTSQTAPGESWSGGVQIYGHASGRCIGIANSPGAPVGSKLVIWDCYNESYQRWKFVNGTVQSEGKCMNVSGGATNNGAVINWTTCNGSGAQQFRLNSSHDLTNPQSGNKCVDVVDQRTDNGARLQLWQCAGSPNQKWSTRTP